MRDIDIAIMSVRPFVHPLRSGILWIIGLVRIPLFIAGLGQLA